MKILSHILTAFLAIALMASCSGSESPSAVDVPADADYVAIVDLTAIAKSAGFDLTDSQASAGLGAIMPDEAARILPSIAGAADLSSVMVYKPASCRENVVAFAVTDRDKLEESLEASGWKKRKFDSLEGLEPEESREFSPCIVFDRGAAWWLATRSDLKAWQQSFSEASDRNFASLGGVAEAIDSRGQLIAFANPSTAGLAMNDALIKITGNLTADSLSVKANLVGCSESDAGKTLPFAPLATIDSAAFAPYMPQAPALVAAAGITPGINWGGIVDLIGPGIGTQNQGMLQTLLPYMSALDGPLAVGIGPLTAKSLLSTELEDQTIILYAPLQPGKAEQAVAEINTNLRQKGLNPTPRPDGIYAYTLGDVRYRYTVRSGAFIFALNREIDIDSPQSSAFAGLMAGAFLTLPPLKSIVPGAKADINIAAALRLDAGGLSLTIVSPGSNPLTAMAGYFSTLSEADRANREAADDYYDNYD